MPDVLSQDEIDALLTALNSGELTADEIRNESDSGRVRVYDFKRAMRFSKEHTRTISGIYENFSRLLTNYFSAQLRTGVQFSVASIDQLPFEEFMGSIAPITVLHVIDVKPLSGKFLLEVPNSASYAMLDRLLGGQGQYQNVGRRMTEIDVMVLERLFSRTMSALTASWADVAQLQFTYDTLEVNPQFTQIANQGDIVLLVTFSIVIGKTSGIMNLCMPHVVLEPLMQRLTSRFAITQKRNDAEAEVSREHLRRQLHSVAVDLQVQLGKSTLPTSDLLRLQIGDVIPLDLRVDESLSVAVEDVVKLKGAPGHFRGHYAVRITEQVEEVKFDE
ncbi:flagellar motor switch protein FliM [Ferroacidibacillus organovorans]|uniref:Flagellar motor switch protein FliM n=1 Tax=Ferroacidibacillus organovorans TaxID=1765683 RepID=A0A162UX91_9BACL|nr:flagellar motor switch protein FliM [Ferroacidibacillus organovorans]KYP82112.1 hypothetical protein AYJ22_00170 [Ferroacidibacillus organovorans]OAG94447.1 hypothetical protein AYW79_05370 [Ferroacidibacillus organovorans]OPG15669.1 flagellar motor switch protein FliM [Ferroacidibacillus organovorans]